MVAALAMPQIPENAIIHGDCLEVLRSLPDACVDAIVTDPPYSSGGRQQSSARLTINKNVSRSDVEWFLGDNMGTDTYLWWMREIAKQSLRLALSGSPAYVFTDWRQYSTVTAAWESVGWTLRSVIVWDKNRGGAMGSYWRSNHEWVAVFTKGKPRPLSSHSFFNTWQGSKPQKGVHPTEKPLDLMRYLVRSVTPSDALILDPFAGSGTTCLAAKLEGMRYLGIEREEKYVAIAEARLGAAPLLRVMKPKKVRKPSKISAATTLWEVSA